MSVPILVIAAATALTALIVTDVLSELLRRVAIRCDLTDRPDTRKAHVRPVPYLGGIAIAVGTLVPAAFLAPLRGHRLTLLILAGAAVAVIGLIDDCRSLRPATRLLAEGAAATAVIVAGGHIDILGTRLDPVIAVAWIVLQTNSFNLLDNMDGAAATVAFVSSSFLAALAYLAGEIGVALLLLALTAACGGFLVHNWAPARMFMGDAGSLFIGFVLSAAAIQVNVPCRPPARMAELHLLTFVATVDTCLVLISRRQAGRSFLAGGTDHASHRLHRLGLSTPGVTLALFGSTALSCAGGLLIAAHCLVVPGIVTLPVTVAAAGTLIWLLLKVPVYPAREDQVFVPPDGVADPRPLA